LLRRLALMFHPPIAERQAKPVLTRPTMTAEPTPPASGEISGKTVQDYIDETPMWADATAVRYSPTTNMQWFIWWLAAAGKFFEGMVVFMTGVALPLMTKEFGLGAMENGVIAAASLFGILIGATAFGSLADRYGRKEMFIVEMVLFAAFILLLTFSASYPVVVVALVGIGLALGCDYPTAHLIISESMPSRIRGSMVLGAFGFQAVGGLAGTAVGFLILFENHQIEAWRWMYASTLVLAVPVTIGRFFIVQSPLWLVFRGRVEEAEEATERLLLRDPPYPKQVILRPPQSRAGGAAHPRRTRPWSALFNGANLRRTILASVPWFLQDLGTYGIGIFTPTILATVIGATTAHPRNTAELIHSDILATRGAAFIDVLLIVGIVFAILLADRVGRIPLQIVGFIGCAAGLLLAALSLHVGGTPSTVLLFTGFMLFSFMTNMGPNAMTYLIAGEVFPMSIRGKGAGFAASFAKIGAVMTAFLFPILLKDIGTDLLLLILVGTSLLGALVTWAYAIETKGVNLEHVHEKGPPR
jgi:MFS transporter, putative metabolite transport protein